MFNWLKKKEKRSIILVNNTITVKFIGGTTLIFNDADKYLYEDISLYPDNEEGQKAIINLYYIILESKPKAENITKREAVIQNAEREIEKVREQEGGFKTLVDTGDFITKDSKVYLRSIPELSIPTLLIEEFLEVLQDIKTVKDLAQDPLERYTSLINFWMWSSLNPNPESREDLFNFIKINGLKINKYGMYLAYRKVVSVKEDKGSIGYKDQIAFISNSYMKVKGWKKSPKNYWVGFNNEEGFKLFDNKELPKYNSSYNNLGNLFDLYLGLQDSEVQDNTYTDAYTHSMNITIGKEVSLPADKCDFDNLQACSSGLTSSPLEK